jgi:hypothetical protein
VYQTIRKGRRERASVLGMGDRLFIVLAVGASLISVGLMALALFF